MILTINAFGEVNVFRPLDFVVPSGASASNAKITLSGASSVDLEIDASTSAGTGHVNITSKTGTFVDVANSILINAGSSTAVGNVTITIKAGGSLILSNIPTVPNLAVSGSVWSNGGVLTLVP